jgi:hypothetical protein
MKEGETEQRWLEKERKTSEKVASSVHNNTSLKNGGQEGKGRGGIKK